MSWFKNLNPFKKDQAAPAPGEAAAPGGMPALPPELANSAVGKSAMAMFFRKWKDPAFLKQLRALTAHMQKDGVNIRDQKAVQEWLEKNKDRLENGELNEAPSTGAKQETVVKTGPDIGRNEPCHCGSGKKFKKCHGR